jgi:hypothetical protein
MAVRVTNPNDIAAVRVDVLDGRVVKKMLEPVETEQRVEYSSGEFVLLVTGEHRPSRADRGAGAAIQGFDDELATESLLVARSKRAAIRGDDPLALAEPGEHFAAKLSD